MKRPRQRPSRTLLLGICSPLILLPQRTGGVAAVASPTPTTCSYSTWAWDTRARQSVNYQRVSKPYYQITAEERDPHSKCTVCEEDQEPIQLAGIPAIYVCKDYAQAARRVLNNLVFSGFPIRSLEGYRVGRSKGPVDPKGLRTQFSNHSFGTAIDVNAEQNGLYTDCFAFGPGCHLLRGGPWRPGEPGTITRDSAAYRSFLQAGWKWGGELVGRQKDFMHFSLSGD